MGILPCVKLASTGEGVPWVAILLTLPPLDALPFQGCHAACLALGGGRDASLPWPLLGALWSNLENRGKD